MPIFEYTCAKCREKFELLVRADTKVACPKCKSKKVTREFSAFAPAGGASAGKPAPSGGG